jgi:hypothetical protein
MTCATLPAAMTGLVTSCYKGDFVAEFILSVLPVIRVFFLCIPQIRSGVGSRHVSPQTGYFDPRFGRRNWTGTRIPRARLATGTRSRSCRANKHRHASKVGIGAKTATFKLRAARSGGEARQLEELQRWRRDPPSAQADVPARPWPARGESWIRDNTPGNTSCAGIVKPR